MLNQIKSRKDVVISMTSYGERLNGVIKTINSLLKQNVRADKIFLFISFEDELKVPSYLWDICGDYLKIIICEDIRSYKKIIPALELLDSYINGYKWLVLCDDDIIYPPDWLSSFFLPDVPKITAYAHRCHLIKKDKYGAFLPYSKWKKNVSKSYYNLMTFFKHGNELFATGAGGIAIPIELIDKYFYKSRKYLEWAPTSDDVWIYYMLKYSGIKLEHSGYRFELNEWTKNSEHYDSRLWSINSERNESGLTPNDLALIACRDGLKNDFGY